MWIMLTKKLSTIVSPPKLSIHWSVPWDDSDHARKQRNTCKHCGCLVEELSLEDLCDGPVGLKDAVVKKLCHVLPAHRRSKGHGKARTGKLALTNECCSHPERITAKDPWVLDRVGHREQNWVGARAIMFLGEKIRVFPAEFSELSHENLREYFADTGSHVLVPSSTVSEDYQPIKAMLDTDQKFVKDAALCDGCDDHQALMVALGMDITVPDAEYPPVGWYQVRPEYGNVFCSPKELEITDKRKEYAQEDA